MSFFSPHLLWLLVPLVILFSWELARHATRASTAWPKIARAWAGAFQVSLGAQHSTAESRPRIWLWFGLACCIVALARPQWGAIEEQVFDQSREVIIAVDLSRSMLAQDVKPSRLDRSKLLIQSLLDGLKGERVGLALFAGTSFLQSPLSSDYEVLREFLPALDPEYLPEGGSNYKAMLETAMQAFGTSAADRYLIILSDGESTVDDWKSLTEPLKNKGIRVIGLGVGTTQGSFIPDSTGGFVKDERGAVVMSRLNSATLQELAQVTGGAYADASAWVDLPALLRSTVEAGRKGEFSEKNTARLVERYQWFLAPGLLLLFLSFWSEFPVRPRDRALPLGTGIKPKALSPKLGAAAIVTLVLLTAYSLPLTASAAAEPPAGDTFAKPLSTLIGRLAEEDALSAKDYAEMAETTVTYGERVKAAQQQPQETALRDALQAVDAGEKLDAKAADWPKLRQQLNDLLKRDDQKQEQQKQDEKKEEQQPKDQSQQNQDQQQQQDQQKSDQQKQDEQKQPEQQQQEQQKQEAFGDMKDQQEQKSEDEKSSQPPPPKPGTQKVGGQKEEKPADQANPELAMPLQKLDQVRDQDSPAKLQQLMQGKQQKPKANGKDW